MFWAPTGLIKTHRDVLEEQDRGLSPSDGFPRVDTGTACRPSPPHKSSLPQASPQVLGKVLGHLPSEVPSRGCPIRDRAQGGTPHTPYGNSSLRVPARAQAGHLFPLRWHSAGPGRQQAAHEGLAQTGGHESIHLFPRAGRAQSLIVASQVFGSPAPVPPHVEKGPEWSPG